MRKPLLHQQSRVVGRIAVRISCLLVLSLSSTAPELARAQTRAPAVPAAPAAEPSLPAASEQAPSDEAPTVNVVRRNFEPSYIAYPIGFSGLPPLILEANIAPHFVVTRPTWPVAFVLTPKILVRMFRERSTPVTTPSYMPRVSVFMWLHQTLRRDEITAYASLSLNHHSNGQTGKAVDANGLNNHETGDFSTNFLELSVYETRLSQALFAWNALAFEWHLGFNQSANLENRYGLLRLKFATTVVKTYAPLDGALTIQVTALLDKFQRTSDGAFSRGLERFPIALQYTVKVPGVDLGAYVGYYLGHDYYNIWFDRVIHTVQFGVAGSMGPVLFDQP